MFFRIHHRLSYRYDRPVFLEPMTLRLTPRQDGSQRILEHHLRLVDPAAGLTRVLEPDGTDAMVAWFQQERDQLTIEVDMLLETLRSNPYDWIITHRESQHLPVDYPEAEACSLAGCRHGQIDPAVRTWAQAIADKVEGSATAFLGALADEIHHGFHHVGRLEGEPTSAAETLATLTGACRDTAVLYIAACRSQGLAARFVSGYSMHHPPEVSEHELHAWAEVYLPGGGWRGFDPSLGLAVADGHVVLAAAPDHHLAAPVSGSYRGTGV
ncbi:transglutaminase family protein, partial [Cyanobium sp. N5-Cardenillas]|uniref:transglutaminase family protein n=1 Tax=Cyanobium sp. N5-Cardenillas TaxID=2823720 RepID=UPI0020CEB1AC